MCRKGELTTQEHPKGTINHMSLTLYDWTIIEQAWRERAACVGFVDTFFPPNPTRATTRQAVAICHTCPVIRQCGEYADTTREKEGVWGGRKRGARLQFEPSGHV